MPLAKIYRNKDGGILKDEREVKETKSYSFDENWAILKEDEDFHYFLTKKMGNLIVNNNEVLDRWKQYFNEHFNGDERDPEAEEHQNCRQGSVTRRAL